MAGIVKPPEQPPSLIKIPPDKDVFEALRECGWQFGEDDEGNMWITNGFHVDGDDYDGGEDLEMMTKEEVYAQIPRPSEIKEFLDEHVIGQEEAKRAVSVALCNHLFRINYNALECEGPHNAHKRLKKNNLLFIGDSGVGKTYILELACNFLSIPFVSIDSTRFSAAGYVGASVEEILTALLTKANGDVEWAQEGVVFIDEFDKIASSSKADKDVNTTQVQYALLKMIEGAIIPVPENATSVRPKEIDFDTSETLFTFAGAFGGLASNKKDEKRTIGFKNEAEENNGKIQEEDILKFGIIPEILGRIGTYIQLHSLTDDQLMQILLNKNSGPVQQAKQLFKLRFPGKRFPLQKKDFCDIIQVAKKSKLGARGLAREVHKRMMEHYYE